MKCVLVTKKCELHCQLKIAAQWMDCSCSASIHPAIFQNCSKLDLESEITFSISEKGLRRARGQFVSLEPNEGDR